MELPPLTCCGFATVLVGLVVVQRSALWAETAMPILGGPEQDLYPVLPSDDGQVLEASALSVYWSPKVRELVHAWTAARNKLVKNVSLARTSAGYRDKAWQNVEDLKKALRDAEDALVAQMSAELLAVEPVRQRHWRPVKLPSSTTADH